VNDAVKAKVDDYLKKAEPLFRNLKVQDVEGIPEKTSREFLDMMLSYYHDAKHFYDKGEYINALAALEYAEGWLDAGKRIGIFR